VGITVGCQAIAGIGDKSFGEDASPPNHRNSSRDASPDAAELMRPKPGLVGGGGGASANASGGAAGEAGANPGPIANGGAGVGGRGGTGSGGQRGVGAASGQGGSAIGHLDGGRGVDAANGDAESGTIPDADVGGSIRTAGVFPNFPLLNGGDVNVRQALTDLAPNGLHVEIPWNDVFYTSDPSCDPSVGCPPCTDAASCYFKPTAEPTCHDVFGYDELECYVRGFALWLSDQALGSSKVSVTVTLDLHNFGATDWRIGPSHIAALEAAPADLGKPQVAASLFEFYDRISSILADPHYERYVGDWTVSFGNHLNDYLCANADAWAEYSKLYEAMRAHALGFAPRPSAPLRVGAGTAFLGLRCEGLWDFESGGLSTTAARIRNLNRASDVLLFQYFPVDPNSGFLALNPSRVDKDLESMRLFRRSQPTQDGGSPPPIVLYEVGYPTDPSLHGQKPSDDRYSRFGSGEDAQQLFVQGLMRAAGRRSEDFEGVYWWPLFDIPGPDLNGGPCDSFVEGYYGGMSPSLSRLICTSGLSPGLGAAPKPAWDVFRTTAERLVH
jgi:hypothetical protein